MTSRLRVLIVDDHPFFRAGVAQWIARQDSLLCCGEADSVNSCREAVAALQPDIMLLDVRLGDGDGLELAREISAQYPGTRIIIVSQFAEEAYAHRALQAGARGYVMKSVATNVMAEAIETVQRGDVYLSRPASARLLFNLFPDPGAGAPDLARLTDRELQVFQLLGAGCAPREIAAQLKISPKTVDTYREHLKEKLNLPDGASLLRAATLWVEKGATALPA